MKEKNKRLSLFNFTSSIKDTEIFTLLGDKYFRALPFELEFSSHYEKADVIIWDGIETPKNKKYVERILDDVTRGKCLIVTGASYTLKNEGMALQNLDSKKYRYFELPGWNILPEQLLKALEDCHQKARHV